MSNDFAGEGVDGPVPHCYRHPNRETLIRCTRCDRPICPECMRPASVGFQCPDDVKEGRKTVRQATNPVGVPVGSGSMRRVGFAVAGPTPVTVTLIGINLAVYVITAQAGGGANTPNGRLFTDWLMVPDLVGHFHQYDRLITSMFLHLSVTHILFNMLALYFVGPYLEQFLGWWRFLAVYMLAGLGGSVAVFAFDSPFSAAAGASGAIFGLFAACWVFVRQLRLDRTWLLFTIGLNFVFTFSVPGISYWAHLGGFVVGGLAAMAIGGLPNRPRRLTSGAQIFGLAAILLVRILVIAVRTSQLASVVPL